MSTASGWPNWPTATTETRQLGIKFSTQLNLDGTNPWTRALTPEEYPPYQMQNPTRINGETYD